MKAGTVCFAVWARIFKQLRALFPLVHCLFPPYSTKYEPPHCDHNLLKQRGTVDALGWPLTASVLPNTFSFLTKLARTHSSITRARSILGPAGGSPAIFHDEGWYPHKPHTLATLTVVSI
jgi:hypothetical protein